MITMDLDTSEMRDAAERERRERVAAARRLAGSARTERKRLAAQENGRKGGRPRKEVRA
jgi:hypothetical protein